MFAGRNSKTSFKLSYKPPLSRQEILCFGLWSPSDQNHFKHLQLETIQNHFLIFKDVLNFLISFNCNFIMASFNIYFRLISLKCMKEIHTYLRNSFIEDVSRANHIYPFTYYGKLLCRVILFLKHTYLQTTLQNNELAITFLHFFAN